MNINPLDNETLDKINLLKRLIVCHSDIQISLSAITFLIDELDNEKKYNTIQFRRLKCYETTFVTGYGRAFTDSSGGRYTKLSLKKIGLKLTDAERAIHKKILAARHRKFAHSDFITAHIRIDLHSLEINGESIHYPRTQWDEELYFVDIMELYRIATLQHKIIHHIIKCTTEIVIELKDCLPIYLRPVE